MEKLLNSSFLQWGLGLPKKLCEIPKGRKPLLLTPSSMKPSLPPIPPAHQDQRLCPRAPLQPPVACGLCEFGVAKDQIPLGGQSATFITVTLDQMLGLHRGMNQSWSLRPGRCPVIPAAMTAPPQECGGG